MISSDRPRTPGADAPRTSSRHSFRTRRSAITAGLLAAGLLGALFLPSRAALNALGFLGLADQVQVTGSTPTTSLEDRIEVQWTTDDPIPVSSAFHVYRSVNDEDSTLVHVAASTESLFEDWSVVPNVPYEYCVYVATDGAETLIDACVTGMRVIARPTGFEATDGAHEEQVRLTWADQSQIEAGFNVYRDAGNALAFDGVNDWIAAQNIVDLTGSYSFEFWAKRGSIDTGDFVINLEVNPNGDPVDVDLEIGFLADNRFAAAFGTNVLATNETFTDGAWHHFAFAYDAPNRRRIIYVDGNAVKFDVLASAMAPTGDLEIGRRTKNGNTASRGHYHGQLDEIRFWSVALTEDQVRDRRSAILTGSEPGLAGYWPFDATGGLVASDFFGAHPGVLIDMAPSAWVPSDATILRAEVPANFTAFADRVAVPGFLYDYEVAAYQDMDGSGTFTPGDYESEHRSDDGYRGLLTPPGAVSATDGEFSDRVRVTWIDMTESETGYRVYRDDVLIATLAADSEQYDNLVPLGTPQSNYCVEAYAGSSASNRICDMGHVGNLQPPVNVAATDGEHDDKVVITWEDAADSEDEFEIRRDGLVLGTTEADATNYADLTAAQGVMYEYCVIAVSKSDPLQEVRSGATVACDTGMRAVILAPTELTATVDDFEDRVELDWSNPSTTALLFEVRRDGQLIQVLDFNTTAATDTGIASDVDVTYQVRGATVVAAARVSQQGQVAQIIEQIAISNAVAAKTGGDVLSPEATLEAVYSELGLDVAGKNSAGMAGLEYSDPIAAVGRRSILPPTALEATNDEFENHVQLEWEDNSQVETGYTIYRTPQNPTPGTEDSLTTLSPNRTTFGDYTGIPGMPYLYRIEAIDEYVPDESTGAAERGFSGSDTALGKRTLKPPTGLTASDGASEEIIFLDWEDNSSAELGYVIYRRPYVAPPGTPGPWGVPIDSTGKNEPAYEDSVETASIGMRLEYRVTAYDLYGQSVGVQANGSTRIDAPIGVNASDMYGDKVVVVWANQSAVADAIRIRYRQVDTQTFIGDPVVLSKDAIMWTDTNPGPNERVYCVTALRGPMQSDEVCDKGRRGGFDVVPPVASGDPVPFMFDPGTLTPGSNTAAVQFGASVAINETGAAVAAIGAPGERVNDDDTGVARLYNVKADDAAWDVRATKSGPAGAEQFGFSVDVSGSGIAIGDPKTGTASGSYTTCDLGATGCTDFPGGTNAGFAVARTGDWIVFGDPGADANKGRAYVRKVGAGAALVQLATPGPVPPDAEFGQAVDITTESRSRLISRNFNANAVALTTATTVTVTAPDHGFLGGETFTASGADRPGYNGTFTVAPSPDAGSFKYQIPSYSFSVVKSATDSVKAEAGDIATVHKSGGHGLYVGDFVTVSGATVNTSHNGSKEVLSTPDANTFTYAVTSAEATTETATITFQRTSSTTAGGTVNIVSDHTYSGSYLVAIVGAPNGSYAGNRRAYVYECAMTTGCDAADDWDIEYTIENPFFRVGASSFGQAVSVDGPLAVVGDPGADGIRMISRTGFKATAPYLRGDWSVKDDPRMPSSERGIRFGAAVSVRQFLAGDRFIVGAPDREVSDHVGAGSVFVYDWVSGTLNPEDDGTEYDARTGGPTGSALHENGNFGASVDLGRDWYLVGAPGTSSSKGAAYAIPFDTEPVKTEQVTEEQAGGGATDAVASDGTAEDRIQIRWTDNSDEEVGQLIYRSKAGAPWHRLSEIDPADIEVYYDRLGDLAADVETYDDFSALPGEAYVYCVTPYFGSGKTVALACDIGWRPANGTIAGLIAPAGGGATEDVEVCLAPSPNKSLILDGAEGHLVARADSVKPRGAGTVRHPYDLEDNVTIEAWVKPQNIGNVYQAVFSRYQDLELFIDPNGKFFFYPILTSNLGFGTGFQSNTAAPWGEWTHVAVVKGESSVRFYINGRDDGLANAVGSANPAENLDRQFGQPVITLGTRRVDVTPTVESATGSGTTATITTVDPHGLGNGDEVIIAGATGASSAFNGTYTITYTGPRTFTYTKAPSASPAEGDITVRKSTYGFGYKGEIDEVRIWKTARNDAQIAANYDRPLTGEEEGLLGYWPLNQGRRLVAPDVTVTAYHMQFEYGAYVVDNGAPLKVCGVTDAEGQYSIPLIRYGETTEFKVTPSLGNREFEPAFQKVTLATDSPVQNQIFFVDKTAYTVAGVVQYAGSVQHAANDPYAFVCPAPDVGIFLSKDGVLLESTLRATTGEDGSFALAVDPSEDENDPWYFTPDFAAETEVGGEHTFDPDFRRFAVMGDSTDLVFVDEYRNTFSGAITGGDPDNCHQDIGIARVRVYTEDGCFNYEFDVDTGEMTNGVYGGFSLNLPPLNYLVEVVDVSDGPTAEQDDRATEFYRGLGTLEIDLTEGDVERNLTYRAPLTLSIAGLEPMCDAIQQYEEDVPIRTLPAVATIEEWGFKTLTISVDEVYGPGAEQTCPVESGTVTIYDAISDRVDADSTIALDENGEATYTVIGTSPNIYSGARIGGVDRSFQKPITVVAQVEGVPTMQKTQWALVEGFKERSATFVSATTERFPLLILHDPPGSNSYAFLEEGTSRCTRFSNTMTLGGSGGLSTELIFGYTGANLVAPFGVGVGLEANAGWKLSAGFTLGGSNTSLQSGRPNREVCLTTTKAFTTSNDMTWVGEDIHVGVALNLIFAIADVVEVDDGDMCKISKYEKLAADINEANPFQTSYVYGSSHIGLSLIPELENLIRLAGGDATVTGDINQVETEIPLVDALDNWKAQLRNSQMLQDQALEDPIINRSFSGGTDFRYAEGRDSTEVTYLNSTKVFFNVDFSTGPLFGFAGNESNVLLNLAFNSEWVFEEERKSGETKSIGYVLSDGDTGDYFSVDVAKDPRYGTFVFGTRSGRSSNPWEGNTQKRDNPIIMVDPPVMYNVDPDDAGRFELTLINGSESFERRQYTMAVPGETNPRNLGVTVTGDLLGGARLESFLLDPGKAMTINMDVFASPSAFSYHRVGVMLYPEVEYNIWKADTRQDFALSDTAFFSVFFDSTGGGSLARVMDEGWNWLSINRPESDIADVLGNYPAQQDDLIRGASAEARFDSTAGWHGTLTRLRPGEAYQARLQKSGLLRMKGDPVESGLAIPLQRGWSWVGYLPAKPMPIADALASIEDRVVEGDLVVGQEGFAQYTNRAGWVGTLEDMAPGQAYQLRIAGGGDLVYPEAPDVLEPRPPVVYETVANGPEWEVDEHGYTASMTMVAKVAKDEVPLDREAVRVAVLAGDDVRGVGDVRYVEALDQYVAFIMVYGPADEEEELRVHVYDAETDELYGDVGTVQYAPQSMLGQAAAPVTLDLANAGLAPELTEVPEEFALYANYPNPFNPATVIGYDLPESGRVSLTVYDVLGRRVTTLVNEEQTAGRYRILFDARQYASGVYLYRLNVGNFSKVGKMMLVK